MRRGLLAACAAALTFPAAAAADGLPVTGIDVGPSGVTTETSAARYVALPAGDGDTLVARVRRDGGQVLRSRVLDGSFTVPAVALDGTRERPLGGPRHARADPAARAVPAARDAAGRARRPALALREVVELRGDFSFDALSPDGRTLYLIEYTSRRDPTRYAVREYDLGATGSCPTRWSTRASRTSACAACRSRACRARAGAGSTRSTTAPARTRSCTRSTRSAPRRSASTSTR